MAKQPSPPAHGTPKPRTGTKTGDRRMPPPKSGVTVRMYRTGLGDCFLLAFRKKPRGRYYALIDCGVFFGTRGGKDRIREVAEDIRRAVNTRADGSGKSRIDLLVITHEHWDHVSAFHEMQARDIFERIDLGKLWLAWTEDFRIKLARDLHAGRKAGRLALARALDRMGAAPPENARLVTTVLEFFGVGHDPDAPPAGGASSGLAAKSQMTEEAMTWLREEYGKGKTEFLHPGGEPLELDGAADARVYVLGPPEDEDLIRRADPLADEVYHKSMAAAGEAAFFAAFGLNPGWDGDLLGAASGAAPADPIKRKLEAAENQAREMSCPFDGVHRIEKDKAGDIYPTYHAGDNAWRRIETDWLASAGEFALQLDNATNNTSLAFALEVGPPGAGRVLLFPGDAQVGNWLSWFGKVKLKDKECGKEMVWTVGEKTVTTADLLARTVLYKVGHHGSHNATLRAQGLELMARGSAAGEFVAMLPVDEYVAQTKAGYGQMPLQSLVGELLSRTNGRLMRNDEGNKPDPAVTFPTLDGVEGAPAMLPGFDGKRKDNLFIEYTVH